jgi:imidazoleglycerol phosphate synthase cyclase subunit/phosphoribosyl-ATP pyrophosphohydrolase
MVMVRVIPCLDVKDGRVVKGVNFEGLRDLGDPVLAARRYDEECADELVFLDISATAEGRSTMLDVVARVADEVFIPLTVGGGVTTVDHFAALLQAGADKVAVNSAALADPDLITRAAERFGAQCVVVAVDAKRVTQADGSTRFEVFAAGGRRATGREALAWIEEAVARGAGEILLTSIDADGTKQGFDLELLRAARARVGVPVIASGGAGALPHFVDAAAAGADGVLAASLFHDRVLTIDDVKTHLASHGVDVRFRPAVTVQGGAPRFDDRGLLPTVLVDAATGEVLTVAFSNDESWRRMLASGETWLWSRSRGALWRKGATSGHTQRVVSVALDCDRDAAVVRVAPAGPACHNGTRSCFTHPGPSLAGSALVALDDVLASRAVERPAGSYTTQLLTDDNKRMKKLGEELVELVRALHVGEDDEVVEEASDLFFHVAVALRARGIPLSRVAHKLLERAR